MLQGVASDLAYLPCPYVKDEEYAHNSNSRHTCLPFISSVKGKTD
jgi:hypothetical protein